MVIKYVNVNFPTENVLNFCSLPEATLENLLPYSKYMVKVRVVGESEEAVIFNHTQPGRPGPPRNIEMKNNTDSALHFVWQTPPCKERCGRFLDYEFVLTQSG